MAERGENNLDRLFSARRIAVVGASGTRSDATGNQMIRNLLAGRAPTEIFPVSATAPSIEGLPTVPSITALPSIDLAVVAVGSRNVATAVEELEAAGCPVALVVSVGLSDADVARLTAVHARGVTTVHGPNCMGVIDVHGGRSVWADEGNLAEVAGGPIALISQSGSGAIFVVRSLDQSGFSRIISSGNEAGLTATDYLEWLADDPQTTTIGLVIESIHDGPRFERAIGRVRAAGKRVAALKVGRSRQGALATVAHTGALVSHDDTYTALFQRAGVPLTGDYDELAATLQVLALTPQDMARPRVGAVTISGGQAALTADIAHRVGVETPPFAPETVEKLRAISGDGEATNPYDAAAVPGNRDSDFRRSIEAISADPGLDAVLVVLDAQTTLSALELAFEDEHFRGAHQADAAVPIIIASSSAVSLAPSRLTEATRVPVVRGIGNALVALRSLATHPTPVRADRPADLPDAEEIATLIDRLSARPGPLDFPTTSALLERYGVPLASSAVATTVDDALSWTRDHGFPVVLKVASQDVAHRSDAGGVVVGITDTEQLRAAWSSIHSDVLATHPGARIDGIEIQAHLGGRIEAFAGFVSDTRLGATIGVGMGGVLVELLGDTARAVAPLDADGARALLEATRLGRLLDGYRSLHPRTDLTALVDALVRLSWLAHDLRHVLAEADLNPILIEPGTGATAAVDALLIARPNSVVGDITVTGQRNTSDHNGSASPVALNNVLSPPGSGRLEEGRA